MGLVGALFPFGAAIQFSDHNCSFLWNNLRHVFCILALIVYIICWVLCIVLLVVIIVISIFTLGIGLFFIWVPFCVFIFWLPFDLIALVLGIVAMISHILACKGDEGIGSAFTSFGISITAVSCMSMYNTILHIVAWILCLIGVGFFMFFVVYFIAIVLLVIAFLAAKKEG